MKMNNPTAPSSDVLGNKPIISENVIRQVAANFDIETRFAEHLKKLQYYDITIILDDSGSMVAPTCGSQTRWDEAHRMLDIICNVLWQLKGEDANIRVLNRPEIRKAAEIVSLMPSIRPAGPTPIRAAFETLTVMNEVPSLIFLITDGEPTITRHLGNGSIENEVDKQFYDFLRSFLLNNKQLYLNVILCTSSDSVVKFWKRIDDLPRVDVIDDYDTEQKKVRGGMTFGTYVAKAMLGSIVPELDDDSDSECCRIL